MQYMLITAANAADLTLQMNQAGATGWAIVHVVLQGSTTPSGPGSSQTFYAWAAKPLVGA